MPKLPPYVQAVRLKGGIKYRAYADTPKEKLLPGEPVRDYGKLRATPEKAYSDALKARRIVEEGLTGTLLEDAMDAVAEETEAKGAMETAAFYQCQFEAIRKLIPGETYLHDVTPERIEELIRKRQRKVKASTINHHLTALHRVFALAILRGDFRGENPVRRVRRPRAERAPIHYFTADELTALLDRVTDKAHRELFCLFAYTGIRRTEASRMEAAHLNQATWRLFVRGKRGTRAIPIAEDVRDMVAAVALPLAVKEIDERFRWWRRSLSEPRLHPHAMRHTFGTALARNGEQLDVMMYLLGHTTPQMSLRYMHEAGRDAAEAVGRLRLLPASARAKKAAAD